MSFNYFNINTYKYLSKNYLLSDNNKSRNLPRLFQIIIIISLIINISYSYKKKNNTKL